MAETPEDRTSAGGPRAVVGLGNPGERYRDTRHNLGFRVVETLAERLGVALNGVECNSRTGRRGDDLLLVLPQTYMNRSGYAVRCLVERHGFEPEDVLVIYDEVALPLGRLRLRPGGSPGGHRGMESVVENLRTDRVPRLRLGCGGEDGPPTAEELVEYVLSPFRPDERETADEMVERAADACRAWLAEGIEVAMNRYN
ncbi:MAG TPA: aminoacyl-tRNA hydrolase [Thermoanaerobaculia bacterium]|nr:aminoacyl-tRNA hydrolase [Thermoanaerobaculia bacterium]